MPLLGQKIYLTQTEENRGKKAKGTYEIPFTNEVFTSKDEYEQQMQAYKQPIWTCQCTGFTGLTYEEALRSETEVRKKLTDKYPEHLEKPVLEIVHHCAAALDVIVDEAQQLIQTIFGIGEIVELKVKVRGKVIRGKVVDAKQVNADELPNSDKENSVSEDHPYSSPQHSKQTKSSPSSYQYSIQIEGEEKIISSIPGKDLLHTSTLPSRDLLQLFIRASAVQAGSKPSSPWVVSEELVHKFDLPSQINEVMLSPYKVMPSSLGNLTSIKRSAETHEMASKSKKRKLSENNSSSHKYKQSSLLDFNKKDNMVLSVVLQRDQNSSNRSWDKNDMTPPKRNVTGSPERVHLDHSYSSPPPGAKEASKPSASPRKPVLPKGESSSKSSKVTKKEKKPAPSKKSKTDNKKESKQTRKSKTNSKQVTKKKADKKVSDSEDEDIIVIDEDSKSPKSNKSGKTDSKDDDDDDIVIVFESPAKSTKKGKSGKESSDDGDKSGKKKIPTKRKLTDHFKSLSRSSPSRSPSRSSSKVSKSESPAKTKSKSASKSPVRAKKQKTSQEDKGETDESSDDDEIPLKQLAKKKSQQKVSTPQKSKTSKTGSQKGTPSKKGTPKKADAEKSTPKKAALKKTPSKTTQKKTPTKKSTPKKDTPKKGTTKAKTPQKSTPKKSTPKTTPKKTTPGKKSPKKSTPAADKKGKKPFKQATLFDVGAKKGAKANSAVNKLSKSPKAAGSPKLPPIANKLFRIRNKDPDLYKKLVIKASKELTEKQINNLKPEVREDVLIKFKFRMEREKWQNLSPEEREKIKQEKREQANKKRRELNQKLAEEQRKLKEEQAKRYEDQDLTTSKPLPAPKLVSMPEGIPNALFGDIAMIVEFLNCYSGLLMPDDPYPITSDTLMKALVSGKEGFAYLSRVLVILLKTLLQDDIADDYNEISMKLANVTVNMHTASELLRLSLRRSDQENKKVDNDDDDACSDDSDSSYDDEEDVPYKLVEKLETCEFFDLEAEEKLELLVCVCHRILGSYAIQDFMEEKQRHASNLWKEKNQTLKEKNDKLREEKKKKKEEMEAKKLEKEKLKNEQNGENGEKKENGEASDDKSKANVESTDKDVKKIKPKKTTKKDKKAEETKPVEEKEEVLDLASVVKRRRILTAQMKIEKAEQERLDKIRRIEEEEIYKKQREAELFQQKFEDGIQMAKLILRQAPVGTDRNHNRYWIFSTVNPGLFIEKGWTDKDVGYNPGERGKDEKEGVEHTIPKVGQNLWFQYSGVKEIDTLLEALDNQGVRESALFTELKKRYDDITRMTFLSRRSGPELRTSDGPKELLDSFKEDISDLELNIRTGQLGGVKNYDRWDKKLESTTKLKDLGALMIESLDGVMPKFLQGIFAPIKPKPGIELIKIEDEEGKDEEPEDLKKTPKVLKWIEAVEVAPTLSRLHVLLAMFESCVKWEKSAANAKCKICRKKDGDINLLLCDECNQPFHMSCLRPALTAVPKGEWKCPACAPSERRVKRSRNYYDGGSDYESESEEEAAKEHETACAVCDEDGEFVQCYTCPSVYHRECHEPPLKNFPRGIWKCTNCVNGRGKKRGSKARQKRAAQRRGRYADYSDTELETPGKKKKKRKVESSESEADGDEEACPQQRRTAKGPTKRYKKKKVEESEEESSSSEEEESEEEEVKPQRKGARGRGRPPGKKKKVESESEEEEESSSEEEEEESEEEEVKPQRKGARGRGRPPGKKKKVESESEEESSSEEEEEGSEEEEVKPQRKGTKGRPTKAQARKKKEEESEEESSEEEDSDEESSEEESEEEEEKPQKRGRGKPAAKPKASAKKATAKKASAKKVPAKKAIKKDVPFDSKVADGIIGKLMNYRGSERFRISPDKAEAPDYEEMIKIPMDLHMVKNKLDNDEFETYQEFFKDVKLIFTNAHQYYQESDYVHKQATKLQEYFANQVKWANKDALSIWESIAEDDSTQGNGPTDQKPTTTRRSSRR